MRRKAEFHALLSLALDDQPWDPPEAVPGPDRYLRALSGVEPLSGEEKKQLLLSPTARLHYGMARRAAVATTRARLAVMGASTAGLRLAADDGTTQRARVRTADFSLSVEHDNGGAEGPSWLLVLTLSLRMRAEIARAGLNVALCDEGGTVWLQGKPDEDGVLAGEWEHPGSPIERLTRHGLQLDLM